MGSTLKLIVGGVGPWCRIWGLGSMACGPGFAVFLIWMQAAMMVLVNCQELREHEGTTA